MVSIENSRVIKNFVALAILQGGNYLLPLILIPFLVRTLGMKVFGDWVFAVSFVSIFRTFVNYGFDMTATRDVSVNRNDRLYISKLCEAVIIIRLIIFAMTCFALIGLALAFPSIWNVVVLAELSMFVLIGEALFPIWLFQGMEQMSTITKLRLGYRGLFVLVVMVVVKGPQDVFLIPIIEGVGSLGAGLIALYITWTRYNLAFYPPQSSFLKTQVKGGASVFVSQLAAHFYSTINTILLGMTLGPVAVGQYSIAEKIYFAIRGMLGPIVQALFPTLSRLYDEDSDAFRRQARRISIGFLALLVSLAILTYVVADELILLIAGQPDPVTTRVMRILSIAIVFALGALLSSLLVVQKRGRTLVWITFSTMVVNLVIVFPLLHYFGIVGMAITLLTVQIFHSAAQFFANVELLSGGWRPKKAGR